MFKEKTLNWGNCILTTPRGSAKIAPELGKVCAEFAKCLAEHATEVSNSGVGIDENHFTVRVYCSGKSNETVNISCHGLGKVYYSTKWTIDYINEWRTASIPVGYLADIIDLVNKAGYEPEEVSMSLECLSLVKVELN